MNKDDIFQHSLKVLLYIYFKQHGKDDKIAQGCAKKLLNLISADNNRKINLSYKDDISVQNVSSLWLAHFLAMVCSAWKRAEPGTTELGFNNPTHNCLYIQYTVYISCVHFFVLMKSDVMRRRFQP